MYCNIYVYIYMPQSDGSSLIIDKKKKRNWKEKELQIKARTPATTRDCELKLII